MTDCNDTTSSLIQNSVADYYESSFREHGATAKGVDWNSEDSQRLRFQQLATLLPSPTQSVSLLDYGCGYGALHDFLTQEYSLVQYTGFDLVEEMLTSARGRVPDTEAEWIRELPKGKKYDYLIASGIFNVRLEFDDQRWQSYIEDTLRIFHRITTHGFACNFLTSHSDASHMREKLYYADPMKLFNFSMQSFSRDVAVLHDYPLFEFCLIVRKGEK